MLAGFRYTVEVTAGGEDVVLHTGSALLLRVGRSPARASYVALRRVKAGHVSNSMSISPDLVKRWMQDVLVSGRDAVRGRRSGFLTACWR